MSLGFRLKNVREMKNMSQMEVAEKIGVSNAVLSNYERDYRDPDTEVLKQLAITYNISVDYLLGLTDTLRTLSSEIEPYNPIKDENIKFWWEQLPKSDLKTLKALKSMWELLDVKEKQKED